MSKGLDTKTIFIGASIIVAVVIGMGGLLTNQYLKDVREKERLETEKQNDIEQREYEERVKGEEDYQEELLKINEKSIKQQCAENSSEQALDLLKDKISVLESMSYLSYSDQQLLAGYKAAAAEDLYLKEDYNTFYQQCLEKNGLD